jgi:nucleoside-diphosphate-sugar epimerase
MARVALVTGASGELGRALIQRVAERGAADVVALDVRPLGDALARHCAATRVGDILDEQLLASLRREFDISVVFHLAALLSTHAELAPEKAHAVNVDGTLNVLRLAHDQARAVGRPVTFVFPSSIAVYGLPDLAAKRAAAAVAEDRWLAPITMYGCTKLHGEHLGRYFAHHYRQLAPHDGPGAVDFRAIRFPGLISAATVPSGGTSDYGAEMLHAAAQGRPYACFVREDSRIPFMAMPDAVEALLALTDAPAASLTSSVYNVTAFSPTAGDLAARVRRAFPTTPITFVPQARRQAIVDSWPEDVDDTPARREWGFAPHFDLDRAFDDYLVPDVTRRYATP